MSVTNRMWLLCTRAVSVVGRSIAVVDAEESFIEHNCINILIPTIILHKFQLMKLKIVNLFIKYV